jgi:4-hydroxythreonine-4-phosphate dehydrogenase
MNPNASKPIVGIIMGDPAGIGPEITVRAVDTPEVRDSCLPIVIGDQRVVRQALSQIGHKTSWQVIHDPDRKSIDSSKINVLDTKNVDLQQIRVGQASAVGGQAVFEDTQRAVRLIREKKIDGLAAGPHNKYSVNLAGVSFAGYPPLLARLTESRYAFNLLVSGSIRIVGATLHLPLKDVSTALTPDLVLGAIEAVQIALQRLGIARPRIAVAGLNPHCGEEGLFGTEEETIIQPAIGEAQKRDMDVSGPFPADSLFVGLKEKQDFDAYVAMYHDQSHIPIKTVAFESIVGLIIGTPLAAATVGHGTAFEIAGKGVANPRPMIETVKLVAQSARGLE